MTQLQLPVVALLVGLAAGSCSTTPTLPLPPPVVMVAAPDADGFAAIEGEVKELAYVAVLNEASDQGVITRANNEGHFKARIEAEVGDLLTIWQDVGDGEQSEQKHVTVPAPR